MPTPAKRRVWRRKLSLERYAIGYFVSAVIVLMLLGFARVYTVTQDLKRSQADACSLRVEGRANTNEHDRVPLKAALSYLGNALVAAGDKQTDPVKRASALAFGNQLLTYADAVRPLPNPKC